MSLPPDHYCLRWRPYSRSEVLADGAVHAIALIGGLIAFPYLLGHALDSSGVRHFAALAVYALGFFLMFGFSMAYNMAPPSTVKWLLRRFDHSMIYVMIAGTYTAILAQSDSPDWAWMVGALIWAAALTGILIKMAMPGKYDRLQVLGYIMLGWVGVIAIGPATASLPAMSLWLLVAGGVTYVTGVAFFVWERLRFQNAIWHCFVAVASGLHFAAIAISVAGAP